MKKKKNSQNGLGRTLFKAIAVILFLPLCGMMFCATLFFTPMLIEKAAAHAHISQMRYWDIPPESEFVELDVYGTGGGTMCWIAGELIVTSNLTQDELESFYTSRYHPQYISYLIADDKIYVKPLDNNQWIVLAVKPYDCP